MRYLVSVDAVVAEDQVNELVLSAAEGGVHEARGVDLDVSKQSRQVIQTDAILDAEEAAHTIGPSASVGEDWDASGDVGLFVTYP